MKTFVNINNKIKVDFLALLEEVRNGAGAKDLGWGAISATIPEDAEQDQKESKAFRAWEQGADFIIGHWLLSLLQNLISKRKAPKDRVIWLELTKDYKIRRYTFGEEPKRWYDVG